VTNTPKFDVFFMDMFPDREASFGRYYETMATCDGERGGACSSHSNMNSELARVHRFTGSGFLGSQVHRFTGSVDEPVTQRTCEPQNQ
jgi:hypothetical protein